MSASPRAGVGAIATAVCDDDRDVADLARPIEQSLGGPFARVLYTESCPQRVDERRRRAAAARRLHGVRA